MTTWTLVVAYLYMGNLGLVNMGNYSSKAMCEANGINAFKILTNDLFRPLGGCPEGVRPFYCIERVEEGK